MTAKVIYIGSIVVSASLPTLADQFGSGANTFTIDFVTVGNAGNGNDTGVFPLGAVGYDYRMGVTEAAQVWITKATNLGLQPFSLSGAWSGNQPASKMTWYEAAAFVNWLNTSTGHQAAYQLNGTNTALTVWTSAQAWQAGGENLYRHKDAYYFLPSENEWYKAAYHKNDGVTANYWNYPTQTDTAPSAVVSGTAGGTAVYNGVTGVPSDVDLTGGLSGYATRGQGGNIKEWIESAYSGSNTAGNNDRVTRGGSVQSEFTSLLSEGAVESRIQSVPAVSDPFLGFRVASIVPEPSAVMLIVSNGFVFLLGRRNRVSRWRTAAA